VLLQTILQVLGFLGAAAVGSVGTWKVIDELLRKGKSSLKEDYRFAKEFLASVKSDEMHPVVTELGYQAIAGDSRVTADEVSYLLGLQNPRQTVRNFIGARHLLEFFSTAPLEKIAFRAKYQSSSSRRWLKYWYAGAYFITFTLGIAPLLLTIMNILSGAAGLLLFVFSAVMFFPLSYLAVKAGGRIGMAESLLKAQAESKGVREAVVSASSS